VFFSQWQQFFQAIRAVLQAGFGVYAIAVAGEADDLFVTVSATGITSCVQISDPE
jgi:hypothetical protein